MAGSLFRAVCGCHRPGAGLHSVPDTDNDTGGVIGREGQERRGRGRCGWRWRRAWGPVLNVDTSRRHRPRGAWRGRWLRLSGAIAHGYDTAAQRCPMVYIVAGNSRRETTRRPGFGFAGYVEHDQMIVVAPAEPQHNNLITDWADGLAHWTTTSSRS